MHVRAATFALFALPFALAPLGGAGCSSDASTSDAGTSSSSTGTTTSTSTSTTPSATGTGTTPPPGPALNGCTTYSDRTGDAAKREIAWGFSVSSTPEACMRIKVGQTVTWNGDLGSHPLAAKGGDSPSPITNAATAKFDKAGTYGFVCTLHSSMQGAIVVVE